MQSSLDPWSSPVPPGPDSGPLQVRLGPLPPVVAAGVRLLLYPHLDRLSVQPRGATHVPHVVVLDPLGDVGGWRRDRGVVPPVPAVPVVALCGQSGDHVAARARALGAVELLPLSVSGTDLARALETAGRTRSGPTGRAPGSGAAGGSAGAARTVPATVLSHREMQVVERISRGMSNDEIARDLYLSINSVKTYIRVAYRKIGVTRRSQAVLWALSQHGF